MDIIREIQIAQMDVNIVFEQLMKKIQQYEKTTGTKVHTIDEIVEEYESVYPLTSNTAVFKGKKPTGVFLKKGIRSNVGTWKKVFELILKDCASNSAKRVSLLNLRGKVSGRERVFLSDRPDNMRSPLKIVDDLFVESHYDTESLLRILTNRLLKPVGYDYTNIEIAIRNSS